MTLPRGWCRYTFKSPLRPDNHLIESIESFEKTLHQESRRFLYASVYLPGLGSTDGEGTAGWVVFGLGFHAAGIAAVVGLRQAKAAQDFSTSCETNTRDNLETALCHFQNVTYKAQKTSLTKTGQVLLLLGLCAVSIDRVHDQWRLDTHDWPVPTVHSLNLSGNQAICHITSSCTAVPCRVDKTV